MTSHRIPEQRMSSFSEGESKMVFSPLPIFELIFYRDGRSEPYWANFLD